MWVIKQAQYKFVISHPQPIFTATDKKNIEEWLEKKTSELNIMPWELQSYHNLNKFDV